MSEGERVNLIPVWILSTLGYKGGKAISDHCKGENETLLPTLGGKHMKNSNTSNQSNNLIGILIQGVRYDS